MTRLLLAPPALALGVLIFACGRSDRNVNGSEPVPASPPRDAAAPTETAAPEAAGAEPLGTTSVTLYFPSAEGDTLAAETREIVDTKRPAERGAQILAALLDGPRTGGALPAFPTGTTLRQLWVEDDGDAYADFSEELASGATGGSTDEILTVYAIVDSLTQNVSEIRRVGILVAGKERDTLGHLDLRRPLPADLSFTPRAKTAE